VRPNIHFGIIACKKFTYLKMRLGCCESLSSLELSRGAVHVYACSTFPTMSRLNQSKHDSTDCARNTPWDDQSLAIRCAFCGIDHSVMCECVVIGSRLQLDAVQPLDYQSSKARQGSLKALREAERKQLTDFGNGSPQWTQWITSTES
jgi:hypothetical protein